MSMTDTKSEAKYSRCSNAQCSGIILADTEDWSRPLCHACWQDIGEPDVEPFNKYSELKEFWVLKENVKNGDVPAGPEKPDYSELFYHTVEKSAYSYAVDQWDYCVEEARKAQAKHERVLQMLEIAEAELKDARDFAMDTLARANQAIETDCDKCDYQCQGCIRAIDDAEAVKYNISIALEKIKSLK